MLVCLRGHRLALVGRVDLPPAGVQPSRVVDELLPHVLDEAPDAVVLVGYEDEAGMADEVTAAVRDALDSRGIVVVDRLRVRSGRWWSLDCTDGCCPDAGRLVPRDEDVPAVADYVLLGRRPAPTRACLDERLEPDPATAPDPALAATLISDLAAATTHGGAQLDAERRSALECWGDLLDLAGGGAGRSVDGRYDPPMSDRAWARLAVSLLDVHLRDLVIAWICPGTLDLDDIEPSLAECELPPRGRWRAGRHGDGGPGDAGTGSPDPGGTLQEDDLLTDRLIELCRRSPVELSPGPLTVLASFTWWRGDGALTRLALERALTVDPGYRLAQLLQRMVDLAIRPRRVA